jgi:Tol biopolymer transport system component
MLLVGVFGFVPNAAAQACETADYVFPDPGTPLGEPNGAVWNGTGLITPLGLAGEGLQIADPGTGAGANLFYVHHFNPPTGPHSASLRAIVQTQPLSDAGPLWQDDLGGARLILDDGVHRAELGFARDPGTSARQLRLVNAPGAAPIPFAWDNFFYNAYEIQRPTNGNFVVTVTSGDPNSSESHSMTYAANLLPASSGAMFAWGSANSGGGISIWREVHGQVCTRPKVVFSSTRDWNFEIYSMNEDGTEPTRLTNHARIDAFPAQSPNGGKIAFTSNRASLFNFDVYTMNADGSNVTQLTTGSKADGGASWSPDGTKLVFTSKRDGNLEIYVMNADGTGQTQVTNNSAADFSPKWSPDGGQIAFTSMRDGGNFEIYVMNADGTGQTRVTNHAAIDGSADWSPGGTIVFNSNRDGNFEIYSMGADGTNVMRLTNHPAVDAEPASSPDGRIVFTSNRDGIFNSEIYSMGADGSNVMRLTNHAALDASPAW